MVLSGDGKFWLYFDLRLGFEDAFMGMRSWRCCRETEIWRAMETSAAVLRRSSCSSISVLTSRCFSRDFLEIDGGAGLARGMDDRADFDIDPDDEVEASESFLRGWATVDVVVALRERSLGGGAWIFTVLRLEAVKGEIEVADMLDAEVEVEWSELEVVEPETEDGVTWCGLMICQAGSSSLGFIGNGAGS